MENQLIEGKLLQNINNKFKGTAPDIGCLEYNKKPPHYGCYLKE